jgi:hypothetical protein
LIACHGFSFELVQPGGLIHQIEPQLGLRQPARRRHRRCLGRLAEVSEASPKAGLRSNSIRSITGRSRMKGINVLIRFP